MKKSILLISIFVFSLSMSDKIYSQPEFPFVGYEYNPVLTPTPGGWDEGCNFLASPFYYDGIYYLYYTGSAGSPTNPPSAAIGLAISADGFNFDKILDPVVEPDGVGFDSWGVSHGIVIEVEGEFWMYYNGKQNPNPGPGEDIGFASSSDPTGPWTQEKDPILSIGDAGEWDAACVDPCSIIKVDSGYLMFYFGIETLPTYLGNASIGMAYSSDGINWEKYDDPSTTEHPYQYSDPVLTPGENGSWDEKNIIGCSVIKSNAGLEMFYSGYNNENSNGIGYATSVDGIEWTKDYETDPYTYLDDPYALSNDYETLEEPGVIFSADTSEYFLYYDYFVDGCEIGMATTPNLSVGITDIPFPEGPICLIYPNPSEGIFNFQLSTFNFQRVSLKIYDPQGREVERILDEQLPAGEHHISWDAERLPSGIYFVRIVTEKETVNKNIILY